MNQPDATTLSTREQVLQALTAFHEAHQAAEAAAAAWNDLGLMVGTNEQTRKDQARSMPPEMYAQLTKEYQDAGKVKDAAKAHAERTEKHLNTLRELLQHDTADTMRYVADAFGMAATMAEQTAMRYAAMHGRTLDAPKPYSINGAARHTSPPVDESDLPF